jgi:hypothetical protein
MMCLTSSALHPILIAILSSTPSTKEISPSFLPFMQEFVAHEEQNNFNFTSLCHARGSVMLRISKSSWIDKYATHNLINAAAKQTAPNAAPYHRHSPFSIPHPHHLSLQTSHSMSAKYTSRLHRPPHSLIPISPPPPPTRTPTCTSNTAPRSPSQQDPRPPAPSNKPAWVAQSVERVTLTCLLIA